jgi:hypothetical protein
MKLQSLVIAALVALPAVSFAQSSQPVTRAEVRAQLVELEKAGYVPGGDATQYPQNIQEAQARLNAQKGIATSSYGEPSGTTSSAGAREKTQQVLGLESIYARP